METIEDIVADMRKRFEPYAKSESNDARYVAYLGYAEFAKRIKSAVKALEADLDNWRRQALYEDARANAATCKESLQVGNSAVMRKALLKSRKAMDEVSKSIFQGWIDDGLADFVGEAQRAISSALSEPARNCDFYETESEAYQAYLTAMKNGTEKTYVYFEPWLFEKAKGGDK